MRESLVSAGLPAGRSPGLVSEHYCTLGSQGASPYFIAEKPKAQRDDMTCLLLLLLSRFGYVRLCETP